MKDRLTRLRQVPFTVTFLAVLWIIGAASGSLLSGPPQELLTRIGLGAGQLADGRWWTPVTSLFWAGGLWQYIANTVLIAVLCGLAERRIGTARTALIFLGSHVAGALLATGLVNVGKAAGDLWSADLASTVVTGPSSAAFGVGLAISGGVFPVWGRRLRLTLVLTMVMLALYMGSMMDLTRLLAGHTGMVMLGRKRSSPSTAPSRVEGRLLVAMVVAASAIGPLLATISRTSQGPLSVLQFLLVGEQQPDPADVAAVCADSADASICRQTLAALRMSGFSSAIMSVIPVLLLLVTAEGLRRGRRFAWWAALALNVVLAWLGIELTSFYVDDSVPRTAQDWVQLLVPLLQPVLVLVLLLANRRKFDVAAPPGTYRRFMAIVLATLTACTAVHLVGALLFRDQFERSPDLGQILADLPARFIPPSYLDAAEFTVLPNGPVTSLLYQWTRVVFWLVVIIGGLITFRRAWITSREADRARAHDMLATHGGTSMSHMITWRGNNYWFSPDGEAVIAYRVISSVALTTGEPVGAPDVRSAAVAQFSQFCAANGWTPCFYSVSEQLRAEMASWSSVQVAEETVLALDGLEFRGKKWQDVRTALNKAKNLGVTAEWTTYAGAPAWMTHQIRSLSRAWLTDKGLPEMGFTLGRMEELADEDVRCMVAVGQDQRVHGITSWLPVRRDGEIVAWTLDFMRRSADAFPGVMEFLIASMVARCRDEGVEYLSLSGAPLARRDRGELTAPLQRLLDLTGKALEPVYGFHSLLAFKAKFQPQYRPLFMTYPDAAALPSIGNAITRAYLPKITFNQAVRLIGKLITRR